MLFFFGLNKLYSNAQDPVPHNLFFFKLLHHIQASGKSGKWGADCRRHESPYMFEQNKIVRKKSSNSWKYLTVKENKQIEIILLPKYENYILVIFVVWYSGCVAKRSCLAQFSAGRSIARVACVSTPRLINNS